MQRLYRDTTPSGQSLASVTIQNCVSRHNPSARPRARALLAVSWPVSWLSRPYRGRPWAPLARPCAPAARPGLSPRPCLSSLVSQYNFLYCDSRLEKKKGSSPFQLLATFFFLFFHSNYWKNTQIYIYIYIILFSFSSKPNKFILFILLPVLHTVKP